MPEQALEADRIAKIVMALSEHAQDAFLVTKAEPFDSPHGPEIIYVNDGFCRMTGYASTDVMGRTPRILQTVNTDRAELDRIRTALETWKPVRATLLNKTKDDIEFWVELDIVPIADENGWFVYWASIQRDVTERVETEKKAKKALDDAEKANATKDNFLAAVSHELRTPLNAIIGFAEVMERQIYGEHSDPRYLEYAKHIRTSGDDLSEMITDLLTVSDPATVDSVLELSSRQVEPVFALLQPVTDVRSAEHGVDVIYDVADDLPAVRSNQRAIRQIVLNLITNAIKASSKGDRVAVSVTHARNEANVSIAVQDRGEGIPDEIVSNLDKAFKMSGEAYVSDHDGFGLGLSIVSKLCRGIDAVLVFEKPDGGGTIATVSLPVDDETGTTQP